MIKVVKGKVKIRGRNFKVLAETYILIKALKQFYKEKGLTDDLIIDMIEEAYKDAISFENLDNALKVTHNENHRQVENGVL